MNKIDNNASPNKYKHLEFIRSAVQRVAWNLFAIKVWSITLIAALFALATKDTSQSYMFIAYFQLIVFWLLDGYFSSQERNLRVLYDRVRRMNEDEIDFSMNTELSGEVDGNPWLKTIFSRELVICYGGLSVSIYLLWEAFNAI
jgi:uncharacterized membrane protein